MCVCVYTCDCIPVVVALTCVPFLSSQATVGAIVEGGAADLDGRLIIGDEITHINGVSVMDASHRDVISLMGEAAAQGEVVLSVKRKMPVPGLCVVCCVCVHAVCVCVCVCVCGVWYGVFMPMLLLTHICNLSYPLHSHNTCVHRVGASTMESPTS